MAGSSANDSKTETMFYTSIDDSSNEVDSVAQYDIEKEIEKFKRSYPCDSNNILSFIGHAAGIYVLYSPEVQKRLKQESSTVIFLNDGDIIQDDIKGQFKNIERFAGKDWKKQGDNYCKIINHFKIFDLSAVAQDNFSVEFLAHLRLHNRSENRNTRKSEKCRDTSWRIFLTEQEEVWVHLCNERNRKFNNSRNEQVYLNENKLANYSAFFSCQTKEEFSILLKNRLNIKKDGKCLSENIVALWYLLFGCEVIKNPAAIIHNNMALDLAEAFYVDETKELGYNFKNIIDDMPMSASMILAQAMSLNQSYGAFMPCNYQYQYFQLNANYADELIEREAEITERWLTLKLGPAVKNYLITQCVIDNKAVETIWVEIVKSFERWGISCKPISLLEEDSVSQSFEKVMKKKR